MSHKKPARGGSLWIFSLAVVATVWLGGQFYPPLMESLWRGTDFRNWTRGAWLGINVAVLLLLLAMRSRDLSRRPIPTSGNIALEQESNEVVER